MYRNSFFKQILLGVFVALFLASCDKDFNEIGTNIIGDDHFGFDLYTEASIKAYNQKLGPIASNNMDINALGIYNNPAFGKTVASFVTQLEMDAPNPTFTTIDNAPVIDSVIMNVPYFSTLKSTIEGVKTYELDSIFGGDSGKIKLGIYESGYYLRDLDPSEQLGTQQVFYTDKNAEIDSHKIGQKLNNSTLTDENGQLSENDQFSFSPAEIREDTFEINGDLKTTKTVPAMRMHLDTAFFTAKILNAPSGQLYNNNLLKNYFRGLYFKVENSGTNAGNMAMLNFKKGKITVYYKEDHQIVDNPATTDVNEAAVERLAKTFVLKLAGNTVSLLDNSNENTDYLNFINNPDTVSGDERLYLKGGEGSMAVIDLFGTTDLLGIALNPDFNPNLAVSLTNLRYLVNPAYNPSLPISSTNPKYLISGPNGVSDEIDNIKANDWLINEANLTFYEDKSKMTNAIQPERIFLFDLTNKKALIDYTFDNTTNPAKPKRGKTTFGGIVEKETVAEGNRTKYKVRITNYVRSLIMKDSTNVRLGLSITENINDVTMAKLKTTNAITNKAPLMSVVSPQGTVLYGTKSTTSFPTIENNKESRLKLEIYYTKPD